MAGISGLFTEEFFEVARERLESGGVFCMWFHTYHQNDAGVQLVLRTLDAVFPHVVVFSDDDEGNLILLASERRLEPDYAAMERRFESSGVRRDLARLGMTNLIGLLTHHRFSEEAFRELRGYGPTNTEARQRLEYAAPRSYFLGEHSHFVERRDPLILNRPPPTGLMLDGYLDWRRSVGRGVTARELDEAARYTEQQGGYGAHVARAVRSRATPRSQPPAEIQVLAWPGCSTRGRVSKVASCTSPGPGNRASLAGDRLLLIELEQEAITRGR